MPCAGKLLEGAGPLLETLDGGFGALADRLEGLGPEAMEAEGNAATVGSTPPNVPLFRAVGPDELSSIRNDGTYGSSPSQGGKYFALTQQGAEDFANSSFNSGQQMTVTGTSVPQSIFDQGYQFNDPGGAGPSIHFQQDFLQTLYDSMGPIIIY